MQAGAGTAIAQHTAPPAGTQESSYHPVHCKHHHVHRTHMHMIPRLQITKVGKGQKLGDAGGLAACDMTVEVRVPFEAAIMLHGAGSLGVHWGVDRGGPFIA